VNVFPKKHRARFPDEYLWLLLVALAAVVLVQRGSFNLLSILTLANIWAIFAISWDILSGFTGQISFGHALFIGLGGYVSALCSIWFGWPIPVTILVGGVAASVGGVLLSLPAMRLRGPYLSLVTLVAALVTERVIRLLKIESSGAEGTIIGFSNLGFDFQRNFLTSTALVLGVAVVLVILGRSRIGKIFGAIRESEEAAAAAGINTAKFKLLAFAISGFVGGVGGGFYAHYLGSVSPASHLVLDISVFCIVAAVIGGMGTIVGPLAGAYLYILVQEYFRSLGSWRFLSLTVIALAILYFLPRGFLSELRVRVLAPLVRGKTSKGSPS